MSWSRKPIQKSEDSVDCDIGPPMSSDESTKERFKPFLDARGEARHKHTAVPKQSIVQAEEDWEVIEKRQAPKLPRVKPIAEVH